MTHYIWDGENVLETLDGQQRVRQRFLYGPGVDNVLGVEDITYDVTGTPTSRVYWTLTDHQGSVRDVIDSNQQLVGHREYDAFGNIVSDTVSNLDFAYAFTGRDWDADVGLYHHRARWYDPKAGRWISQDPMGFEAGDTNLYRYVGNDPVNKRDPSGMEGQSASDREKIAAWLYPESKPVPPLPSPPALGPTDIYYLRPEFCATCHGGRGRINIAITGLSPNAVSMAPAFQRDQLSMVRDPGKPILKWILEHEQEIGLGSGALEAVTGAGIAVFGGPVGWAVGGVMLLHGLDLAGTSGYNLTTGERVETRTMAALQAVGLSREAAQWVDTGISLIDSIVGIARAVPTIARRIASSSGHLLEIAPGRLIGGTEGLKAAERAFANELVGHGHTVEVLATGAGRTPDFIINGVRNELKSLSGVAKLTPDALSGALANRVMNGRGQATYIIVDARAQAGMTREIAERGVRRAYGADNLTGSKIQSIRVIGVGFDITVPRVN